MKESEVAVSVFCLAYNHEKFIRKTLEGFISQETTFKYEVLIHDDASTDGTAAIIREYANKYPDIIKPIFQTVNQYSQKVHIAKEFFLPISRGKYIAWCEGDDFWTDPLKLQKQVDALEKNQTCVACICRVERVSYTGISSGKYIPLISDEERVLPQKEYLTYTICPSENYTLPWQLSGLLVRSYIYCNYLYNPPEYVEDFRKLRVGDIPLFLYLGQIGDIYYIDDCMSCYRTGNPDSFVGRSEYDPKKRSEYFQKRADALMHFDIVTDYEYHDAVVKGIKGFKLIIALKLADLKTLRSEEYNTFFKQLSARKKVYTYISHYFPNVLLAFRSSKRAIIKWINRRR